MMNFDNLYLRLCPPSISPLFFSSNLYMNVSLSLSCLCFLGMHGLGCLLQFEVEGQSAGEMRDKVNFGISKLMGRAKKIIEC